MAGPAGDCRLPDLLDHRDHRGAGAEGTQARLRRPSLTGASVGSQARLRRPPLTGASPGAQARLRRPPLAGASPARALHAAARYGLQSAAAQYVIDRDVACFQLDDLRNLVRQPLSKIGRVILSALIVIEVHARDVVHNMVELGVETSNDFEWISQLR